MASGGTLIIIGIVHGRHYMQASTGRIGRTDRIVEGRHGGFHAEYYDASSASDM